MPIEQLESLAHEDSGVSQLDELDYSWLAPLDRKETKEFERARKRGFVVYRDSQPELGRIWWRWCEAAHQPHVAIKAKRRYAWVMLDMPLGVRLSPQALDASCDAVNRHTSFGGWGFGPQAVGHPKVPIDEAESLAEELLCIARQEMNR